MVGRFTEPEWNCFPTTGLCMRDMYYKELAGDNEAQAGHGDVAGSWQAGRHTRLLKYDDSAASRTSGFDSFGGFTNKSWASDSYIGWARNTYVFRDTDAGG